MNKQTKLKQFGADQYPVKNSKKITSFTSTSCNKSFLQKRDQTMPPIAKDLAKLSTKINLSLNASKLTNLVKDIGQSDTKA